MDRSPREKRHDPLQATPPPPPPAQYSQGAQPSANTALGLHAHTKGPTVKVDGSGVGRQLLQLDL